MNSLQRIQGQISKRKRLIFVLVLLLLGASFTTFGATKAHASGHSCMCFVHTSTPANTFYDYTVIDESQLAAYPMTAQSKFFVTPDLSSGGVADPHPVGVWFTGSQWAIFNEDQAAMPQDTSFNVQLDVTNSGQIVTATSTNILGDSVLINSSSTNNNPKAALLVTPNWGTHGIYDPHPIGVWFTGSQWAVFNEDRANMPQGVSFNFEVATPAMNILTTAVPGTTSTSDYVVISASGTNFNPDIILLVTPNWGTDGVYDPHPIEILYFWGRWIIFNEDGGSMPAGASFNVVDVDGW